MYDYKSAFSAAQSAAAELSLLTAVERNDMLRRVADAIEASTQALIEANQLDLERMDPANPLFDRLLLTLERLAAIAADMRRVAELPCPVDEEIERRELPNGLLLRRVRVPFGVVGVIFEARPNVTFDVFALCFKTANACVLKGGADAEHSNRAAAALISRTLGECGVAQGAVTLLPSTHQAAGELLNATGYIDVCIPRGGRRLIDRVRAEARVPVIETGAGVVNTYFDIDGDLEMGARIVLNGKTRRVSVCNALDTLLIHRHRLPDLPALVAPLAEKEVELFTDSDAHAVLRGSYPARLLHRADSETWATEWMAMKMGVCTVADCTEAINHINRYGSGHSEAIVTDNPDTARVFQNRVDAACVYVNAPTSFTDGGQFGLGAEIGISTQKLGPRGPMGLTALTTYRWLINGHGQVRE